MLFPDGDPMTFDWSFCLHLQLESEIAIKNTIVHRLIGIESNRSLFQEPHLYCASTVR